MIKLYLKLPTVTLWLLDIYIAITFLYPRETNLKVTTVTKKTPYKQLSFFHTIPKRRSYVQDFLGVRI